MGLSSALATAMAGLRSTQASLSIISSNVANAQTPGYVAQNPNQIEISSGTYGSTVQTTGVNRQLDLFVQSQLRTETAGGAYADQIANILGQLQSAMARLAATARWRRRSIISPTRCRRCRAIPATSRRGASRFRPRSRWRSN